MNSSEYVAIGLFLFSGVFTLLFWLVKNKMEQSAELIKDLYIKHEADADKLNTLELSVERTRYTKSEVDTALTHLTTYLDRRFDKLEEAIKK